MITVLRSLNISAVLADIPHKFRVDSSQTGHYNYIYKNNIGSETMSTRCILPYKRAGEGESRRAGAAEYGCGACTGQQSVPQALRYGGA